MTTFALPTSDAAGANIRYSGSWTWGSVGGHNEALVVGDQSRIDTKVATGSGTNTLAMTVFTNSSTQPVDVYFDGVVQTRPTISSTGAWVVATLATNIPAGTNVSIQCRNGMVMYFDTDYGYNITDGTTPTLSPPDNFGTTYDLASAPFSTYSRREGGFQSFSGLNYAFYDGSNIDMSLRLTTNATQIRGWLYGAGGSYVLYKDGVQQGSITTLPNTLKTDLYTFASGLSGTHEYEIHIVNGTSGSHLLTMTYLMLVGGTLSTTTYAARDQYGFWGDSITQADITSSDSRVGFVYKVGQALGVGVMNAGHNSWRTADILYDITNTPPTPPHNMGLGSGYFKRWIVMLGVNDINTGVSTATYQANMTAIINALVATYPSARGTILKILPLAAGANETARPSYNAVLPAAISGSTGGGTNVDLFDVSTGPGGTYTSADTIDGTHPSSAGYTKIALNLEAQFTASAYTLTLSAASGYIGSPVTLSYAANGTSTAVVTPGSAGVAGAYSPTTATLNGIATVTQTFTPSAAGTATFSPTNSASLTDPSPQTYTVLAAPATPAGLADTVTAAVVLTWSAATNATGYRIYKNGSGTPLYDGAALTYTDNITLGTSATYKVTAYNPSGESALSSLVTASGGSSGGGGSRLSIGI